MALFGDLVTDALGGFGSKPKVPPWQDINLSTEQGKAIAANQSALPASEALVSSSNQFSQDQITKMLEQALPGYTSMVGSASTDIESMLKGQIPSDVSGAIQSSDAAQALTGGYSGSGAAGNLVARDLGLTSLNLTQQGISSAQSWMQSMNSIYAPSQMNVSSMFITPQQMFSSDMTNAENKWGTKWLHNQVSAMPDPATAAIAKDVGGITDSLAGSLGSSLGGVAGGALSAGSGGGGGGL